MTNNNNDDDNVCVCAMYARKLLSIPNTHKNDVDDQREKKTISNLMNE